MSTNKPSYAAIASTTPSKNQNQDGAGPSDAPPPYSEPSASHASTIPHQTVLPPPPPPAGGHDLEAGNLAVNGWTPPPTEAVAKSRALKRFWMAFFWAWVIWIVAGLLIGGGVSDVEQNPVGRHGHWDKHGDWHNDRIVVVQAAPSSGDSAVLLPIV